MTKESWVLLGDWPLPIIGGRPHIACNPNQGIFNCRGKKTLKNRHSVRLSVRSYKRQRLGLFWSTQPLLKDRLLEFDLGAGVHQLLHGGISVGFGDAFLDVLRCAIHQIFGFLEAQTSDFTHRLDD